MSYFERKTTKQFFSNRNIWIRIQAHEQEYQAIEQEVQELELTERSQVLPQDVSKAHDIFARDVHAFIRMSQEVRLGLFDSVLVSDKKKILSSN